MLTIEKYKGTRFWAVFRVFCPVWVVDQLSFCITTHFFREWYAESLIARTVKMIILLRIRHDPDLLFLALPNNFKQV